MMIENSMFYINFEVSSDSQKRCVEEIKRIGLDDIMNPIYLLKKRKWNLVQNYYQ